MINDLTTTFSAEENIQALPELREIIAHYVCPVTRAETAFVGFYVQVPTIEV